MEEGQILDKLSNIFENVFEVIQNISVGKERGNIAKISPLGKKYFLK